MDIDVSDIALLKTVRGLADLSIHLQDKPCQPWQQKANVFLTRSAMMGMTLYRTVFPNSADFTQFLPKGVIHDYISAWNIVRSVFEGYINMNYLFVDPKTPELRDFRLLLAERHAICERVKMAMSSGITGAKLEEQRFRLRAIEQELFRSKTFNDLKSRIQKEIRKGTLWACDAPHALNRADRAGVDRSQSEYLYKMSSNHVHAENLSLEQIAAVNGPEGGRPLIELPKIYGIMYLALTLSTMAKVAEEAKHFVGIDQELVLLVQAWEEHKKQDLVALRQ